jgi:antitoxin YefM
VEGFVTIDGRQDAGECSVEINFADKSVGEHDAQLPPSDVLDISDSNERIHGRQTTGKAQCLTALPVFGREPSFGADLDIGHWTMTRIQVMSDTMSLAEVKAKFSQMIDRVEHTHDRITVTRNGRPAAVLISPEELASLEDTLELLSDPVSMAELHESRLALQAGDVITGDQLRSKYPKR